MFEDSRRSLSEDFARGGQAHAPVTSLDELRTQFLLKLPDLMTERGLRDIQQQCGFAEVELLRKHAEVA